MRGIKSHLVGVNTSVDEVFQPGSIAFAHIYRAKGNEAPMVYAIDAQRAVENTNSVTARNTLFTAITRSRAWVRITGYGDLMPSLVDEIEKVVSNSYQLEFKIPTVSELARIRHIHRERSDSDEAAIKRVTEELQNLLKAVDRGDIDLFDLPPKLRTNLLTRLRANDQDDDA